MNCIQNALLNDHELPVKVEAAMALSAFLASQNRAEKIVEPNVSMCVCVWVCACVFRVVIFFSCLWCGYILFFIGLFICFIYSISSSSSSSSSSSPTQIQPIVQELLKVIKETENDDLTNVMCKIVTTYTDQLTPIAVEMCTQLAATFQQVCTCVCVRERIVMRSLCVCVCL